LEVPRGVDAEGGCDGLADPQPPQSVAAATNETIAP
jgi:hypothetical protein